MSAKHTPGPWRTKEAAGKPGNDRDIAIIAVDEDGHPAILAECFENIRHGRERAYVECAANSRLIAAAPELLEALIPFAKFAFDSPHVDELMCHNCRARAAIAKAEGAA